MIAIADVLKSVNYLSFIGNETHLVDKPVPLRSQSDNEYALRWVSNKNIQELDHITKGTIICGTDFTNFKKECNYIISENPRLTFLEVLNKFYVSRETPQVSSTAIIHPSVKLGKECNIGHHVIIEQNCTIGDHVSVDHHTVIKQDTEINDHVQIGANCTIGGVGFGYEQDLQKKYILIPHLGNVIIRRKVEIGNNTCIDRAVLGSTVLEENVKVDNLVHIAHGVTIGKNSLIIANSMIAGSTKIGENVWVAPSASILNKKTISDNSFIGMGAVVLKDVEENQTIVGNPGKPLAKSENKS